MIALLIAQAVLAAPPVDPAAVLAQARAEAAQTASTVATQRAAEAVAAQPAPDLSAFAKKTDIPDITPLATKAELPQPAMAVGQSEMVGGALGDSTKTYKRGDWVPPRISRTARCSLATTSTCVAPWEGGSFPVGTNIRLMGTPSPINASGAMPVQCNATAITVTNISIRCWLGLAPTLNLLGQALNPFGAAPTGTEVQVTGIPSS